MADVVFWLYLTNATLLMVHEIESAYRQEWKLFRLPGGITFFLIFHLPLVPLIMLGLVQVHQETLAGQVLSLVLSSGRHLCLQHSHVLQPQRPSRVQDTDLASHPHCHPGCIRSPTRDYHIVAPIGYHIMCWRGRGAGVVYQARLESVCRASDRGFESHPLRHSPK